VTGVVFGIDPGSVITGYGAVREEAGKLICVDAGVVKTPSGQPFPQRIGTIYRELCAAIARVGPDEAAVESVFHAKARGVAILAAVEAGLPIHEYPPAKVKRAVAGGGRADKRQVRMMVETLLGQRFDLPDDATDALAVAICHLHAAPLAEKLSAAEAVAQMRRGR
jgi:crossover junction endodeoxyribonuclease RuvC